MTETTPLSTPPALGAGEEIVSAEARPKKPVVARDPLTVDTGSTSTRSHMSGFKPPRIT